MPLAARIAAIAALTASAAALVHALDGDVHHTWLAVAAVGMTANWIWDTCLAN